MNKIEIKRQRNREAATRCRQRRVQKIETLENTNKQLYTKIMFLNKEIDDLKYTLDHLKYTLQSHKLVCPISDLLDISISTKPTTPTISTTPTSSQTRDDHEFRYNEPLVIFDHEQIS